jgi:hypothetical protein
MVHTPTNWALHHAGETLILENGVFEKESLCSCRIPSGYPQLRTFEWSLKPLQGITGMIRQNATNPACEKSPTLDGLSNQCLIRSHPSDQLCDLASGSCSSYRRDGRLHSTEPQDHFPVADFVSLNSLDRRSLLGAPLMVVLSWTLYPHLRRKVKIT